MSSEPISGPIFRLRGNVDGAEQVFDLGPGEHNIGSARSNSIILPDSSVSRRHARLSVEDDQLHIEDLGSTNGTFVAGQRAQERTQVAAGSLLRLGRLELCIETVAPGDSRLALAFDWQDTPPTLASSARREPEPSTMAFSSALSSMEATASLSWMDALEEFVEHLAAAPEPDLEGALAQLGANLSAAGCAAVRWSPEGPVLRASWGALGSIPSSLRLTGQASAGIFPLADDPPSTVAWAAPRGNEPVGLVIRGPVPATAGQEQLLRALARVLALLELREEGEPLPTLTQELSFPAHYRPGRSAPMRELYRRMARLLSGRLSVLILGETGVGKELVARTLHESSDRAGGPFVAVNCAAIPGELLESEMFGVERGVATGVEARPGKFLIAEGGTLFLDEVGEMAPPLQAKLLRALQESEIQPLGGRVRAIDVRVVAATNIDLEQRMEDGRLRPDLYYRLAGGVLDVPALRQCREDLPGLVEHFLRHFSRESGVRPRGVTVAAMEQLISHPWPGNVRELENEVRRLVFSVNSGQAIGLEHLSPRIRSGQRSARRTDGGAVDEASLAGMGSLELAPAVGRLEEQLIREALARSGGNKSQASRMLGLSRNGLKHKLSRLGIEDGGGADSESAQHTPAAAGRGAALRGGAS